MEIEAINSTSNKSKANVLLLDSNIFDQFKSLSSKIENERISSSIQLIEYFTKNNELPESDLKRIKVNNYILKRLIRGMGSSTFLLRQSSYSTFVAILKCFTSSTISEIFKIMEKELHVGKEIGDKEDSNAIIGHILIASAILQSELFDNLDNSIISSLVEILINASKHKNYHATMAYTFLVKYMQTLSHEQFQTGMWFKIKKEIHKPWEKQTINTIYFLLETMHKYPNLIDEQFLQTSLKTTNFLSKLSYKHINRLLFSVTSTDIISNHPIYITFENYLALIEHKSDLQKFWLDEINEICVSSNKIKEIIILRLITKITETYKSEIVEKSSNSIILKLLTPRFIKLLITSLKMNQQKIDNIIHKLHGNFFNAINSYTIAMNSDSITIDIIKKFILHPGIMLIEKYMPKRYINVFINQLKNSNSIYELFKIYKDAFLGKIPKDPNDTKLMWLNNEKQFIIQMMYRLLEHKSVQNNIEWRTEQIQFFFTIGIFNCTNDGEKIITKDNVDTRYFTKDIWLNIKNVFYQSLQIKVSDLEMEKKILLKLINYCNPILQKKNPNKYLRYPLKDTAIKLWQKIILQIDEEKQQKVILSEKKINKKQKNIKLIFHILLLQMLLQLFCESDDMAIEAILDLEKCMENAYNVKKIAMTSVNAYNQNEPIWIDVVIDLFLHLLSKNMNTLRIIVNRIFPHLCSYLSIANIHQILYVLDMKNNLNPLTNGNVDGNDDDVDVDDDDNDDDDEDDDGDENENDSSDDDANSTKEPNNNNSKNSSDEEEEENDEDDDNDEDDEDDIMEEEEGTVTDQLRNTISMVLQQQQQTSKSLSGIQPTIDNDDMDSIDLNDMDDEEGERLDKALSEAFKMLKKPGSGNKNQQQQQSMSNNKKLKTKKERIANTTLMHFRVRVLDLIEIYLTSKPIMFYTIEIMKTLTIMLQHCLIEKNLQTLDNKLNRVIKTVIKIKQFDEIGEITELDLTNLFQQIIEIKSNQKLPINDLQYNNTLIVCCKFLINCSQELQKLQSNKTIQSLTAICTAEEKSILNLLINYLMEFLKSRNPKISYNLLQEIFKLRWIDVFTLGKYLCENGLNVTIIRVFRRTQAIELLTIIYRNNSFIQTELKQFNKFHKIMEINLQIYLNELKQLENQSVKEFSNLLDFLLVVHRTITKFQSNLKSTLNWKEIGEIIQTIRLNIFIISIKSYVQFCRVVGIKVVHKIDDKKKVLQQKEQQIAKIKGKDDDADSDDDEDDDNVDDETIDATKVGIEKNGKRKLNTIDNKKQKKMKKEHRLKISSEGLNGFSFSNNNINIDINDLDNVDDDDDDDAGD